MAATGFAGAMFSPANRDPEIHITHSQTVANCGDCLSD